MSDDSNPTTVAPPRYQRWGGKIFGQGLWHAKRLWNIRVAHYDRTVDPSRPEYTEPCLFLFWHEYIALTVSLWAHTPVAMLVSQHRDAEWLNQAAEQLGFAVVRGSTRRGGTKAIRELRQKCKTHSLAITPDGPQGPRRKMAMGPVFLASMFQLPIVPVGVGFQRLWRANTWDRFAIGKPFSRARIIMGKKFRLPRFVERDEMESYRLSLEAQINQLTDHAEEWASSSYQISGEVNPLKKPLLPVSGAEPTQRCSRRAA